MCDIDLVHDDKEAEINPRKGAPPKQKKMERSRPHVYKERENLIVFAIYETTVDRVTKTADP